jgi:UDP-GlcNAc3NAcA epimerase
MKIVSIVGARPQFVKAAVIARALRKVPETQHVLIHTGQHYDSNMSDVFLEEFQLRPDYNLGAGSGLPGAQTARMLESAERVLLDQQPDWVVVYGDTNSTLAGALATVKLHLPLAHLEAGLRCFDLHVPEELNRVVTDHVSDLLFAPTTLAVENLLREGISSTKIFRTGDVMYDAFLHYRATCNIGDAGILQRLQLADRGYVLATVHRAENTDNAERLTAIIKALAEISRDIPVLVPLHPRTQHALTRAQIPQEVLSSLRIMDAVKYSDMMKLEEHARLIVTDSGGVQKEAFFYRVPCVILRGRTEWQELVQLGWSTLVGPTNAVSTADALRQCLSISPHACVDPYGDGHSAEQILEILLNHSRASERVAANDVHVALGMPRPA